MYTETQLRAAAAAAIRNAESIFEDVGLLYEADRWARTVSLSIIGQEELGKAVIYAVAALDRLPGLREVLLGSRREDPVRHHQFKQLVTDIASISHFMAEDLIYESDGMAGPATYTDWVNWVLGDCADWLGRSGVINGAKARRAYVEGSREQPHELELAKWRGLYVDMIDGDLHEPQTVDEFEARMARVDLGINLEVLARLGTCSEDDEMWSELDRTPVDMDVNSAPDG